MRSPFHLFVFALIILLAACKPRALIETLADDSKEQIAHAYIRRVIEGDVAALAAELAPGLRNGQEIAQLEALRAIIPKEVPTVTNLVGYQTFHSIAEGSRYTLVFQFGYGSKWLLVTTAWLEKKEGRREILTLRAQPMPESLQEANALSFKRAGPKHYLFLTLICAIPIFIIWSLVACVRTKTRGRKWPWILFILFGFVQFSLNWTTGQINVAPLSFSLFGASATAASIYAPWFFSFTLPLGAALFWLRRPRWEKEAAEPSLSSIAPTPPPL